MASRRIKKDSIELKSDGCVYIHDLDSYAPISNNCITVPLNIITDYLDEIKNKVIVGGSAGTGKTSLNIIQRIMSELENEYGDVEMNHPVITSRKIMKDIVSVIFSDTTIVIMSRTDYDENEIFFEDLTKEEIIREFALEVY